MRSRLNGQRAIYAATCELRENQLPMGWEEKKLGDLFTERKVWYGMVSDTLNLKYHNFADIRVIIPEKIEQRAIAEVLQTADNEIKVLSEKLTALEKQKRGLMQKLLTGK